MVDAKLHDEEGRLAALHRYDILHTREEEAFERITSLVQAVLKVPIASITLIDRDRTFLKSRRGMDAREQDRSTTFCHHSIQQREPMIVTDARHDPRFRTNPLVTGEPHVVAYAGVPLQTPDGYQIGALCIVDMVPRSFDAAQIEILHHFAQLVVEQFELRQIAARDHLTGALTRRAFVTEMDKAIAGFHRYQRPATLLLFDIDHFKLINDTHGHPAGDRVLAAIADYLRGRSRIGDCFGRLGGEEFGILLGDSGAEAGMAAADRFRAALAALAIGEDPVLRVTASFGVAPLTARTGLHGHWLEDADAALYRAKQGGRNRCCLADQPAVELVEQRSKAA